MMMKLKVIKKDDVVVESERDDDFYENEIED